MSEEKHGECPICGSVVPVSDLRVVGVRQIERTGRADLSHRGWCAVCRHILPVHHFAEDAPGPLSNNDLALVIARAVNFMTDALEVVKREKQ